MMYLLLQALDGFLLVASSEGTIVYLSESVHHHLGIFQVRRVTLTVMKPARRCTCM